MLCVYAVYFKLCWFIVCFVYFPDTRPKCNVGHQFQRRCWNGGVEPKVTSWELLRETFDVNAKRYAIRDDATRATHKCHKSSKSAQARADSARDKNTLRSIPLISMCVYIYIYICTHICIHVLTYIHTYIQYIYIYIYTYIHIYTHIHTYTYKHTNKQIHMHTYVHTLHTHITYTHIFLFRRTSASAYSVRSEVCSLALLIILIIQLLIIIILQHT